MSGENASHTALFTTGDNGRANFTALPAVMHLMRTTADTTEKIRLPSFRTLLESLSSPCTLRDKLSESPSIRNSPTCASSPHRALSPSISASSRELVSSGTDTDTASETYDDENIERTTNQVAQWIEEYHATSHSSPQGGSSPGLSDPATPLNQTAGEVGASEDSAAKYTSTLLHHVSSAGGQLQPGGRPRAPENLRYTALSKSFGPTLQAKIAKGALTTVLEASQDDPSRGVTVAAASSARSVSPQTVPPEPQPGLASSSPAQTSCACAMCQRSGKPMTHQRTNSAETRPAATYCVPPERSAKKPSSDNGTRSQNKSGSPDSAPTSDAPQYDFVVMNLAPALTSSSDQSAPRGRPPRAPDSDQFHVFWANNFKPLVWQEYAPPGKQRDQQERPRARGAKRQRPSESLPAARKKKLCERSSMGNNAKGRVTAANAEGFQELSVAEHQDCTVEDAPEYIARSNASVTEHANQARPIPEVADGNSSLGIGAAMSQEENNVHQTDSSRAENLSGLPWYAVPRQSDAYIIVDSKSAASGGNKDVESTEGFSPFGGETSEEQVTADESSQEQQADGVQLEDAPEHAPGGRETGDDDGRSEPNKASNGLPWYARRRPSDVYISVD